MFVSCHLSRIHMSILTIALAQKKFWTTDLKLKIGSIYELFKKIYFTTL